MTLKEWKKVARILKETYKEVESEALSAGVDIFSDEYKVGLEKIREKILAKLGFTVEEYKEEWQKYEALRKSDLDKNVKIKLNELSETHIPTSEQIKELAEEVAEEVVKRNLKPPQITNQIVKEITKEVIKEEPKIIETVRVKKEEYDDTKILKRLAKLDSKIAEILIPHEAKLKESLAMDLQKNIDMLGMPDFRKLGMGLQAQIDELKNTPATGGGHTIQDEGTPLTQRTNLNFVGAGVTVTDDAGNDATVVTIGGGGSASAFTDLTDVPASYTGETGKGVRVNATETGLEFYTISGDTDEKVKYDVGDPTAGYVADKIIAGTGISVAEGTGANENKLVITNSGVVTEADPYFYEAVNTSKHYTGFPDRTSTSISWDDGTYTLTLTATSDPIWVDGVSYDINTLTKTLTVAQEAASGLYWFWITAPLGVPQLNCDTTPPGFDKCLVATVYWNTTTSEGIISDERHWMGRDKQMHEYLHETIGARYASGMAGTFTDTTFEITAGEFYDEDIEHSWSSPITTARVMYHNGDSDWAWDVLTTPYKVVNPGVDDTLYYNNGNALATVDNNKYVNYWVYATGEVDYPIQVFLGTAQYVTLALARAAQPPSLGTLGTAENKLIYKITYQNVGGTPDYDEATDYRTASNLPTGSYVATDHGTLTGLTDLDHPASAIINTPAGGIAATTVQAAIDELDTEKAPKASPTFTTSINGSYLTASEILITDGSKNIVSAAVATYPSLTELSYVKGVTSAIQTQLGNKQPLDADLTAIAGLSSADGNFIVGSATGWVAESGATARTSLGLGTGDSPQFTAIELGHASDTTITRSAAGVIAVEGTAIPKGTGTLNEIAYWSGTNTLGTLATATYPSLTELSYVKGLTSAVQTQINAKAPTASPTFTGEVTIPNTGLHLLDTNASHDLIIAPGSDLSADRTLTIKTGNTDMIVDFTAVTDEYVLAYDTSTNTWRGVAGGAGGGANTALSNLASVAINTSLVSDTDSTDDLGSSSVYWANTYTDKIYLNGTATLDGTVAGFTNITGGLIVDTNLLYTDTTNARVGINTTAPSQVLEVISETLGLGMAVRNFYDHSSGPALRCYKARGTAAAPRRTQSGDVLGGINGLGYYAADSVTDATVTSGARGQFQFLAQETYTSTAQGCYFRLSVTPSGSTTAAEKFRLTGEGVTKLAGTALRGTTEGTNHLDIFDGTDPVGTLTNGISLYSSGGEFHAMNDGGDVQPITYSDNIWMYKTVSISSAEIQALNSSPKELIAAPGAGKALIVDELVLSFTYGTTQYTSGGSVKMVYRAGTTNILGAATNNDIAATIIQAAASSVNIRRTGCGTAIPPNPTANTAVDLYAATGNFATGDGTAKAFIKYRIITL